ncbi:MAG: Glutathione-regulated potassium-efflux system protein KefB [Chroococcopsis gigantea SAG 12.99]|jgi:CPA2 family monovalent cation:H+ antiporter-2|nr:cation:proton antiporter [Chlorogloea purpurea SAG 13.99]MDV3001706.1 Glutathione-regulated potassium-efflux system protein KefB [Chroococcopsis gigantea SAG 12.99]
MTELIAIFAAAAVGGVLASVLSQPIILGYLVAGLIVGPFGLGFIHHYEEVETVAELGVTFLLFTIGVEFSFTELQKVKNISLGGGGLQITLTIGLTILVSVSLGWVDSIPQGLFLGELLSLSSTAVVLKALMEQNETNTLHGQVMLGILIVQDLALGLMLAVLPALNQPLDQIGIAVGIALVKLVLFALGAFVLWKWVIPPYLGLLARTESRELFLLGVVALCLGIALITGKIGLSTEMGAFVAGLIISEVDYVDQTLDYVEPIRDVCAAAFFVSIGVLINPVFLWENLPVILGLVALVVVAKFLIITPIVLLFRYPLKTALIAGLGLAQIGEFSFVLAGEGRKFGLLSPDVYLMVLGTTAVTLVITPFILRAVPKLFEWAESTAGLKELLEKADVPLEVSEELPFQDHTIVCGYGRVGSNIVRLLREQGYPVVVLEQSEQQVEKLRDQGIPYLFGNAASLQLLEKAGIAGAKGIAVALPDPVSTRLCVKRALSLSPDIDLVTRANAEEDIETLYQLGAQVVVQPEFEASLELSALLFNGLGLPPLDIDGIRSSHYLNLRPDRTPEQIEKEVRSVTRTMNSKRYALPPDSTLIGTTIEKAHIRTLTGVTVIEIGRADGERIEYPDPRTTIQKGDNLLLVGGGDDLKAFDDLATGKIPLPAKDASTVWLKVPKNSALVGESVEESSLEVPVQAIRRGGKYIRFPDAKDKIEKGDRLLLFGNVETLARTALSISANCKV